MKPLLLLPMLQVVMKVVQLLPDGHRMKKEVDMALDTVSETMTPMHYHLREIIICTYRQVSVPSSPSARRCPGPLQPGSGTSLAEAGSFLGLKLSGMSPERCQGSFGRGHPVPSCIPRCPASRPASRLSGAILHSSQHPG